jgi:hypothetical protein
MRARVLVLTMVGAVALAGRVPASAQYYSPPSAQFYMPQSSPTIPANLRNIVPYTGMMGTNSYVAPAVPNNWTSPAYSQVFYYPVPVYVQVPVMPDLPAVQPVRVTIVTLGGGALDDVRVKVGGAVTWVNATGRQSTVIVEPSALPAGSTAAPSAAVAADARQTSVVRPDGSFSLAFNQPGTFDYYLKDQPGHRARVIVGR